MNTVLVTLNDSDPYDGPTIWTFKDSADVKTESDILHIRNANGVVSMIPWSRIKIVRVE